MKKVLYFFIASFTLMFTACIDTEEKTVINENGSGDFSIAMDMGKMIAALKQMGQGDKKMGKKDTVIYFKSFVDTSTSLTAPEKEMLRDGKLSMKIDEDNDEMKIVLENPFKKLEQLAYLKENLPKMMEKIKPVDKTPGDSPFGGEAMGGNGGSQSLKVNPVQDLYKFSSTPTSMSYKLINKEKALEQIASDPNMASIKQMGSMMGDMMYTTIIILPRPATKVEGTNAKLSVDKKTLTVKANITEVLDKPELLEYLVEF